MATLSKNFNMEKDTQLQQKKQSFRFRFWNFLSRLCFQAHTWLEDKELQFALKAHKYDRLSELEEEKCLQSPSDIPYETQVFFMERKICAQFSNVKAIPKPILSKRLELPPGTSNSLFDEALMNLIQRGRIQISKSENTIIVHIVNPREGVRLLGFS